MPILLPAPGEVAKPEDLRSPRAKSLVDYLESVKPAYTSLVEVRLTEHPGPARRFPSGSTHKSDGARETAEPLSI